MSKFKKGDKVLADIYPGTVTAVKKENGEYIYTVEFDNVTLIPPELDFKEKYLKKQKISNKKCPFCKTEWKITKFNSQTWEDCEKCGKTKEELEEDYENYEKDQEKMADDKKNLLEDFEKMLIDWEDDDDGGFWPV